MLVLLLGLYQASTAAGIRLKLLYDIILEVVTTQWRLTFEDTAAVQAGEIAVEDAAVVGLLVVVLAHESAQVPQRN